VINLRVGEWN